MGLGAECNEAGDLLMGVEADSNGDSSQLGIYIPG
jgi:hypothetical protein